MFYSAAMMMERVVTCNNGPHLDLYQLCCPHMPPRQPSSFQSLFRGLSGGVEACDSEWQHDLNALSAVEEAEIDNVEMYRKNLFLSAIIASSQPPHPSFFLFFFTFT